MKNIIRRRGFTLPEILIVIAVIAAGALTVIYFLNPSELSLQANDSTRIADISQLDSVLPLAKNITSLGAANTIYVSVPDPTLSGAQTSTCSSLGLVTLPAGQTYWCVSSQNYRNVDGTGWIPVDLTKVTGGSPIGLLPVDPKNQTSTGSYYAYATDGTNYEITANVQSVKYSGQETGGGGPIPFLYAKGTSLTLIKEDYGCANGGPCVWVADFSASRVQKFDYNGNYLATVGSSGSGNGQLSFAWGVTVDSTGNIWVQDGGNHRIQKFDSNGNYLLQSGSSGSGNGQFSAAGGSQLGIGTSLDGYVYAGDGGNHRVEKFDSNGNYVLQFGTSGSGDGQFNGVSGIGVDSSGNVYAVDSGNISHLRVEKFDSGGNYLAQFGSYGSSDGQFLNIRGLAVDSGNNIYVADGGSGNQDRVQKFDSSGNFLMKFGSYGTSTGQFRGTSGVTVDANGTIYVSDNTSNNVQIFDASGTYLGKFASGKVTNPDYLFVR